MKLLSISVSKKYTSTWNRDTFFISTASISAVKNYAPHKHPLLLSNANFSNSLLKFKTFQVNSGLLVQNPIQSSRQLIRIWLLPASVAPRNSRGDNAARKL